MKNWPIFTIIIAFSSLSLFIIPHTKIINRPLIGLHDMNNGHLLTTAYLWREEGILTHAFAPIYSFPPQDLNLRTWGMVGKNNRMYHASYPPLSFWLVYLSSFLPGVGITEAAARLTSLGVFIIALTFLFSYLFLTYNLATAIFGAGLFSLVPASAYFFGGVIVADIAVFAFLIPAFVLLVFYWRYRDRLFLVFFLVSLGLAVLTEWLGLIAAVTLIIYLLLIRPHKVHLARLLGGIVAVTALSLAITLAVYLSISTPKDFFTFLKNKYYHRGNIVNILELISHQKNISDVLLANSKQWYHQVWLGYLWREFTPLFWGFTISSLGVMAILYLLRAKKAGKIRSLNTIISQIKLDNGLIVSFLIFPPLAHTFFLSEFHFIHDYSFLAFLPALCLILAKGFFAVSQIIEARLKYRWQTFKLLSIVSAASILLVFYLKAQPTYHFLFVEETGGWTSTIRLFETTRKLTNPDDLILTNHDYYPDRWIYLKRNAIMWVKNQNDLAVYSGYYPLFPRVFYVSDYRPFFDAVCGNRLATAVAHGWMCRIK